MLQKIFFFGTGISVSDPDPRIRNPEFWIRIRFRRPNN
jgi:hypothetical protein